VIWCCRGAITAAAAFGLSLLQAVFLYPPGFGALGLCRVVVGRQLGDVGLWVEGRWHGRAVVILENALLRD
jgi:hypothetical protein